MNYAIALAALKQSDPILATLIDRVGFCTLDREQQTGDLLSALCESVLYQQLSGRAAATIHRQFLALYPEKPLTAQDILSTPDDVMQGAGVSRSKIIYWSRLFEIEFLQHNPFNHLCAQLIFRLCTYAKCLR
jgi:DNA-3-methyladenine glycosylase II